MEINNFKTISIRGRVAFGILCLESAFQNENKLNNQAVKYLLDHLWEFTASSELDEWLHKMEIITPDFLVLSNYEDASEIMNKAEYKGLINLYSSLPEYLVLLIEQTIWIGISNIYENTGDFSKRSLDALNVVLISSIKNNLEIPSFNQVSFSKFKQFNGWGKIVLSRFSFESKYLN